MYQLGWFSTGRDKAARDLLTVAVDSIKRGELKAKILFVFCNRGPAKLKKPLNSSNWWEAIIFISFISLREILSPREDINVTH